LLVLDKGSKHLGC